MTDTQRMVTTVIDTMSDGFQMGKAFSVKDFGTFEIKKKMERIMVNPATQQRLLVPPKLVLNFKPDPSLKSKLRKGDEDE